VTTPRGDAEPRKRRRRRAGLRRWPPLGVRTVVRRTRVALAGPDRPGRQGKDAHGDGNVESDVDDQYGGHGHPVGHSCRIGTADAPSTCRTPGSWPSWRPRLVARPRGGDPRSGAGTSSRCSTRAETRGGVAQRDATRIRPAAGVMPDRNPGRSPPPR
jgi:hypothetical protein